MTKNSVRKLILQLAVLCPLLSGASPKAAHIRAIPQQIAGHTVLAAYDLRSTGIIDPYVNVIFQDHTGQYWMGTDSGLIRYDETRGSWTTFTSESAELVDNRIRAICQSRDNKLWFAHNRLSFSFGPGLSCFDGQRWAKIDATNSTLGASKDPIFTYPIHTMFRSRDGRVWFAVLDGLIIYDGQTWTRRIELSKAIGDANPVTVNAGYQDSDGYIWLGRGSKGVIRLDERSMEWKKYNPMQVNVSYVHDGLDDLREAGGTGVSCIYEDRNGRLWFAASDGRVYVHDGPSWSSYNLVEHVAAKRERAPAMPSLQVSAIYQDSSGQMMFATDRGLVTFRENENKWSVLTSKNSGLPADLVYTIMEDKVGRIWLGTKGVVVLEQ